MQIEERANIKRGKVDDEWYREQRSRLEGEKSNIYQIKCTMCVGTPLALGNCKKGKERKRIGERESVHWK